MRQTSTGYGAVTTTTMKLFLRPMFVLIFTSSWAIASRYSSSEIPRGSLNDGKCRLVINEFNTFPNGVNQFIELRKVCDIYYKEERVCPVAMRFYKLLFISHDGFIIGSCKFQNKAIKNTAGQIIFTISAKETSNNNLNIDECHFAHDVDDYNAGTLPVADQVPIAMALLYNQDEKRGILDGVDVVDFQSELYKKARIDLPMEKKIVQNLMDILVYTGGSPFTSCEYFQKFYSGTPPSGEKLLRDWGQLEESLEWSLSRCTPTVGLLKTTDFMPFQSNLFVYTPRSPGLPNFCEQQKIFSIEDHLTKLQVPLSRFVSPYRCYITASYHDSDRISSPTFFFDKFKEAIASEETAAVVNHEPDHNEDQIQLLDLDSRSEPIRFIKSTVPQQDFERSLEQQLPLLWTNCDWLEPVQLIPTLKSMENPPLRWEDILKEEVCYWFDWLPSNRFRCKLCNTLLRQDIFVERDTSPMITKIMTVGQINHGPKAKYLNSQLIKTHLTNPLHGIAVEYASLFQSGLRGEQLRKEFERPGGLLRNHTYSTENLIAATYAFNIADTTFEKQTILRDLLNYFNVSTGKVFANPMGHKRIALSISAVMHKQLVEELKRYEPSFSLLIDASTDVSALPALAVIFQTLDEKKNLKTHFYRIIWLNGGEGGEEIYRKLVNEVQNDGLWDYVQRRCIGFASDGGSNVKLVKRLLEREVDHPLFSVHCYAHKTELVIKHAWEDEPLLQHVEDSVNTLHRVFGSRSAKKKQHLMDTQEELGDRSFTLKRLHKTRWINGRLRALEKIVLHWKTIVVALEKVIADRSIRDKRQRLKAKDLMRDMKDPIYLITVAFVADCYTALSSMSLKLQDRGVTLIGKRYKREKLKETLSRLKSENGPFVRKILFNAEAPGNTDGTGLLTIADFETKNVILEGIQMNPATDRDLEDALHKNRDRYIELILEQLQSYFPMDPADDMDVFDPQQWPLEAISDFGVTRMKNMNNKLKWNWNEDQLLNGWNALKISITQHADFNSQLSQSNPEGFWTYFLEQDGILWSEIMKTTITNILVLPASTAEVERVFSHYTRTKTVRRFSLRVESVDALVRLQLNGPKNISELDTFVFAKEFLKNHARSDDTSISLSRKRKRSDELTVRPPFFDAGTIQEPDMELDQNAEAIGMCDDQISPTPNSLVASASTGTEMAVYDEPIDRDESTEDDDYLLRMEVAEILASLGSTGEKDDRREL